MALSKKTFPKAAGAGAAAFDALANFETVTYTGNGGTQKITGYIRKGAAFDGSSSKIDLPNSIDSAMGSNNFTISYWVNLSSRAGSADMHISFQYNMFLYSASNPSTGELFVVEGSNTHNTGYTLPLNTWTNVT